MSSTIPVGVRDQVHASISETRIPLNTDTPTRLLEIDNRKSAIELRALQDGARRKHDLDVPVVTERFEEINTRDVSNCETEDKANRAH